jgi:geranylgeranyl pyrophosphate synthase
MACLESLEKAFPPITALGIPHVAVPLLGDGCSATTGEIEILRDWLRRRGDPRAGASATRSYLPELRAATLLFEGRQLDELLAGLTESEKARRREGAQEADPSQGTETLALEWLRAGGKRFRPFITLASHAAASGQGEAAGGFSLAVRRVALAIEALHKASLVHDDIEDDDSFRYGRETLHRRCGVAAALNVGDYLIGLGYRLVASGRNELGQATAVDILARLSEAHMTLCRGQGEEILWARRDPLAVRPEDVQRIYALKTAPAFEAALYSGARTAELDEMDRGRAEVLRRFCRFVGVAYQLLNDLKDWNGDRHDKLIAGQDSLATRPTMLLALALEKGDPAAFRELATASKADMPREVRFGRLRKLYEERGAFDKVRGLVEKYRRRARDEADGMQPEALRDLMRFIVEILL